MLIGKHGDQRDMPEGPNDEKRPDDVIGGAAAGEKT
jgi:hypothetical protein